MVRTLTKKKYGSRNKQTHRLKSKQLRRSFMRGGKGNNSGNGNNNGNNNASNAANVNGNNNASNAANVNGNNNASNGNNAANVNGNNNAGNENNNAGNGKTISKKASKSSKPTKYTVKGNVKKHMSDVENYMKNKPGETGAFYKTRTGSYTTRFMRGITSDISDTWTGNKSGRCAIIPDRNKKEIPYFTRIRRLIKTGTFLRKEDHTFKKIFEVNAHEFCFRTQERGDKMFFYRMCNDLFYDCIKTPETFYEVIHDIIDEETLYKAYLEQPNDVRTQIVERIMNENPNIFNPILKNEKKLSEDKIERQIQSNILSILITEVKKYMSMFIVKIFIKSFIDYIKKAGTVPKEHYSGSIKMRPHIEKVIKDITSPVKKKDSLTGLPAKQSGTPAKQSGGAQQPTAKNTLTTPVQKEMSLAELEKIKPEHIEKGLKDCAKKKQIKEGFDEQMEMGGSDDTSGTPSDGTVTNKPWFLYMVIGALAITTSIELGIFDAPPCLSHTFF